MTQLYLDYRGPAIEAGAVPRSNGSWVLPKGEIVYYVRDALRALGAEPRRVDPPKTRSFAAIRRSYSGPDASTYRGPGARIRAYQYALHVRQNDAPHSANMLYGEADRRVTFDHAPDGSKRARNVYLDGGLFEIPHWDWTPAVEELPPLDVAA